MSDEQAYSAQVLRVVDFGRYAVAGMAGICGGGLAALLLVVGVILMVVGLVKR